MLHHSLHWYMHPVQQANCRRTAWPANNGERALEQLQDLVGINDMLRVVEQLLGTFVQVFRFGVWLIHPRNVHNVYVFSGFTINCRVKKNLPSSEISVRPPFKSLVLVSLETASKIFNPEIVVKLVRCINVLVFIPEFS